MDKLSILIVQNHAIIGNKQANFDKIQNLLQPFQHENIDIIVLPEVWAVGWLCSKFNEQAEDENNSPTLDFLKNIATSFNSYVFGGSFVRKLDDGSLRNTCPIFNRKGNLIAKYDKMHLFTHLGADEGKYVKIGQKPVMVDIDGVKAGVSICYDIRFCELFRAYSSNGAKILINMAAWPLSRPHHWKHLQAARAIENQCFMIAASQCGEIIDNEYNLGHSMLISPFGDIIEELNEKEGIIFKSINLNEVDDLRKKVPTLEDKNPYGYSL